MTRLTRKRLSANIFLFSISLVVAFVLCELIVRAFVPVRNVGPSFSVYDDYYGKRLKKSFRAERITPEFTMTIKTNSLGFRGTEPPSLANRPILFLGDSFTLGYGVSDGEEFPALISGKLRQRFPEDDLPIVNNGLGDSGNGRWVKFLQSEGDRYDPQLVVLQAMANDFGDNPREGLFRLSTNRELVELQPKMSTARYIQTVVEAVPGLAYSYLVGKLREISEVRLGSSKSNVAQNQPTSYENDDLTFRLIERTLELCKEKRYPVLFVSVGIKGERLMALRSMLEPRDVPIVEIPDKDERPDLYYIVDGHWNPSGHVFVADAVFDSMLSNNFFDP